MDEGTQWCENPSATNGSTGADMERGSNEENVDSEDDGEGPVDPKELILKLGINPGDVTPYPSLAITRNTSQQLQNTKQLFSRLYRQESGDQRVQTKVDSGLVTEQIVPLQNGSSGYTVNPAYLCTTQSLPAWPVTLPRDIIKYGRKGNLSQKRTKRVVICENAQPKVNEGFWRKKGVFQHTKTPIQDRLPPRSKSHIGFPRSATSMQKRRELPDRPHTSDMTGYVSKISFRNLPNGVDPDLINPRLLVDVLESENVAVTTKDIYNASGWKNIRESQVNSTNGQVLNSHMKGTPAIHLKRALRPKHGIQRGKGDGERKLLESRAARNRSPVRQVTSTPDVLSQNPKHRFYGRVMLSINSPDLKFGADDKPSDKSVPSPRSSQIKKGNSLKSPRLLETSKTKRNTTVVPINLHSKDTKSSQRHKIEFPNGISQSAPRLLYETNTHEQTTQSKTDHINAKTRKPEKNDSNSVSISESNSEYFMDISISKWCKGSQEKTQISRNRSDAIPLKVRNLVTPSNTPVISRQNSQDWLDKSFDQLDCSYD